MGSDALFDFHDLRIQHLGQHDVPVEDPGPVLVGDAQRVAEAARDEEGCPAALALEQRVGRHRGAHLHRFDVLARNDSILLQGENFSDPGKGGIPVAPRVLRQQLVRDERPVGTARDDVGERAAAVNPELPAHLQSNPILNNKTASPSLALLGLLMALPALGTDLFVPSLPALGAPVSAGQFTLTAYFVGLAAGMLFWGPLSDRFGRRPVLLAGLATMLAASLAAALVESITAVAAARLVQGIAMSSGAVTVRSIVRDLHAHAQAARMLASITIVFSIIPIAAPLAGRWSWQAVFWGLAAAAAALLAATAFHLRETAPQPRRSIRPGAVVRSFAAILADRRFYPPTLVIICAQAGILAWVSNSA